MQNSNNYELQILRLKYLFKRLEMASVVGGAVTMVIPPKKQIHEVISNLNVEMNEAGNIKTKSHRNSVIEAQGAIKEKIKLLKKVPENGLVIFSGCILEDHQRTQKRFLEIFEPYRPVNLSLYYCDKYFRLEQLKKELLVTEPPFGYIILDGEGVLFALLRGTAYQIIYENSVTLPNRHNRGGQSKLRFERHATEARHVYLSKVCEYAIKYFIENNKCNVEGIILAGSAGLKNDLQKSSMLDQRLEQKVINVVDVAKGGVQGLQQAIQLTKGTAKNSKLFKDRELLNEFFDNIVQDTGMVVNGIKDTTAMLENGMIDKLIVSESLSIRRVQICDSEGEREIRYLKQDEAIILKKGDTVECDQLFAQWLITNSSQYGCSVSFVGDQLPEGVQFSTGYGGFGGYLRHKVEISDFLFGEEDSEENSQQLV